MVIKPSFDKDNIYNFFNIYIIIINLKKAFNPLKWIFQIQLWFSTIYQYNTIFSIHGNFLWWLFLTHFEAFSFRSGAGKDFLGMLVCRE